MSPALHILLSLANCSLLCGMLLRPRRVRLEAQNFHVWLRWEPDPSSPSHATYQVEWRKRTSSWIKADACRGNSTGSWECELYFDRIHDMYWARVRAVAGGEQSEWASSSELQLYRDTIVGPPKLSWLLQDQILSVNIVMPLTPYKRRTGSYKPVDRVLLKLRYWLHLYEGDLLVQQVPCKGSSEDVPYTFGHLKPRTWYCVRTAAAGVARERSREAEQCLVTPAGPAGSQVPSQLEKDEEAGDGDDVPEQLVPVGLIGNSYVDDRDSLTPETWHTLHLQLYSKCQCPAPGAGSHLPLPMPGRSCSQEDLRDGLSTARHWVPLSSVKLPDSEEEEGGQLLCALQPLPGLRTEPGDSTMQRGDLEQSALGTPSPCQPPPLPCTVLQAAAFSGYEPRAPPGPT
ncbi:interleukin-22 receptor subunit alpha-1-like isoform X2 [Pitangus sulphuratus]|nr:interleukin-22 receptor subunit alpha-1-like isoform X2 [Pitangus sulphuratus]